MSWSEVLELLGMKGGAEWLLTVEGIKWIFRICAGIAMFVGHTRYGYAVLTTNYQEKPDDRPHRGTWFTWAFVDLSIYLYMLSVGTATSMTAVDASINLGIFVISLFVGINLWKRSEKAMVIIASVGIALYWAFMLNKMKLNLGFFALDHTEIGLLFACCATTYGVVPTWWKERKNPGGEDNVAWAWWMASCVCGVIGIPEWTISNAAQPLAFIIVCGSMTWLLFYLNPHHPYVRTAEDDEADKQETE